MFAVPPLIDEQETMDDLQHPLNSRKELLLELDRSNKRMGIYRKMRPLLFKRTRDFAIDNGLKKLSILELGSGSGGMAAEFIKFLSKDIQVEYHVMDIDPMILSWVEESLKGQGITVHTHLSGDTHLEQFQDEQFDFIISLHVLHHIHPLTTLASMFAETRRVAKYGFWAVDYERKASNMISYYVANFFVQNSKPLRSDGLKSLRRSYTREEILEAMGTQPNWNIYKKYFWWNPFQVYFGTKSK